VSFATLNGVPVVSGSIAVPLVGMWTADLAIATDAAETGAATIVVGNLTLKGTIFRADTFAGQTRARVIGGAGGWRKTLPAKPYGSPGGVTLAMVLQDAAKECGETVNVSGSNTVGQFYVRPKDLASFTLRTFCPSWYVDVNGVTQTTAWPTTTVGTPFTPTDQRPDEGLIEIATEDYAAWLPGAQFTADTLDGQYRCFGCVYVFKTDGVARVQVLTSPDADRLLGPLHSIIDQRMSGARFFGRYRYTILTADSKTVDCTPIELDLGLPGLQAVPLNSDSISTYTPPVGGECHVMFLDGSPTLPVIVWTEGQPTMASLLGGPNPVARQGDQVQSFLPPSLLIVGTGTTGPFTGTITVANPITGAITQGSSQVSSA